MIIISNKSSGKILKKRFWKKKRRLKRRIREAANRRGKPI